MFLCFFIFFSLFFSVTCIFICFVRLINYRCFYISFFLVCLLIFFFRISIIIFVILLIYIFIDIFFYLRSFDNLYFHRFSFFSNLYISLTLSFFLSFRSFHYMSFFSVFLHIIGLNQFSSSVFNLYLFFSATSHFLFIIVGLGSLNIHGLKSSQV